MHRESEMGHIDFQRERAFRRQQVQTLAELVLVREEKIVQLFLESHERLSNVDNR